MHLARSKWLKHLSEHAASTQFMDRRLQLTMRADAKKATPIRQLLACSPSLATTASCLRLLPASCWAAGTPWDGSMLACTGGSHGNMHLCRPALSFLPASMHSTGQC